LKEKNRGESKIIAAGKRGFTQGDPSPREK
jgi:hypothetical protein